MPSPTAATAGNVALSRPLQTGEYAITANRDDHSLSIVPIGLASVVATVPVEGAPLGVATARGPDRAFALIDSPTSSGLAVTDIDAMTPLGAVEVSPRPDRLLNSPGNVGGPLLMLSDADNTLRSLDPDTGTLGPAVQLGAGPHAAALDITSDQAVRRILISSAGEGVVSAISPDAKDILATIQIGRRPVGVAPAASYGSRRDRVWVADGEAGTVTLVDLTSGATEQTIQVGPGLTSMAATAGNRYLVLSSSDPLHALYAIDISMAQIDPRRTVVQELTVDGGVLAVATGLEPTLAFITTGDNRLLYWDLTSNTIKQSISVGQGPVSLTLGFANPSGFVPIRTPGGSTDTGAAQRAASARQAAPAVRVRRAQAAPLQRAARLGPARLAAALRVGAEAPAQALPMAAGLEAEPTPAAAAVVPGRVSQERTAVEVAYRRAPAVARRHPAVAPVRQTPAGPARPVVGQARAALGPA